MTGLKREGKEGFRGKGPWVWARFWVEDPDGRTPNSERDELEPMRGRGGCDDERLRPMPRLLAVLAGRDDAVNRTTGSDVGGGDMWPELGTAVPGGDEREEDWDESVPVEDLLRLCKIVPPEIFERVSIRPECRCRYPPCPGDMCRRFLNGKGVRLSD